MGWDFSMVIDAGGPRPLRLVLGHIICTSNVYDMFYKAAAMAMPYMHGLTGDQCRVVLRKAIAEMEENPEKYRKMGQEDGYGSYDDLLKVLRKLLDWCRMAPKATMNIF